MSKVKDEIAQVFGKDRHCRVAYLSAIINGICSVDVGQNIAIRPRADNPRVAAAYGHITGADFTGMDDAKILQATGFISGGRFERRMNRLIVRKPCCKRAYLRASFLCAGSVNGPGKTYHLEFAANDGRHCSELTELLSFFGLSPKTTMRKNRHVIYFKEGEQVAEVLNIINAHKSLLEFENNRAEKEMGNAVNRIANCGAANIDKSVSAAVRQIEDIRRIAGRMGLASLPPQLLEYALIRTENPELSLVEIGKLMSPPISKSGVNHRIRKIVEIAKGLK
jgi:hypothetical protein